LTTSLVWKSEIFTILPHPLLIPLLVVYEWRWEYVLSLLKSCRFGVQMKKNPSRRRCAFGFPI
jgi:hypothetical protein